jgi:imidazolonepropionase-like amidohydrolase
MAATNTGAGFDLSRFESFAKCAPIALVIAALLWSCSSSTDSTIAVTHVTVIDATGSPPQSHITVLIKGQNIAALGPSSAVGIPSQAHIVDGTGKFLIPALADMHVHVTGSGEPAGSREFIVPLLLANGITTVRDMGGYLESLVPLRQDIEKGKRLGPQIFFAGPYLDGNPPSFQPSLVVTNRQEAADDIHTLVPRGVDFIKVQSILSREAYFAIADICRRERLTFVGHVPDRVTAAEASDAGQKSIEHLTDVLRACSSDEPRLMREQLETGSHTQTPAQSHVRQLAWQRELLQSFSDQQAAALIAKFARNQTWQVPTLILLRNVAFATPQNNPVNDPDTKYIPRSLLQKWLAVRNQLITNADAEEFAVRAGLLQKSMQVVAKMQSFGVLIMAGTDTGAPFLFPGSALHDELALLVQAALTPMQALQAATKSPADFLGKSKTQGTIEPGKSADLLLLDANPLEDIRKTRKIRALILHGKLLDRSALDDLLAIEMKFAGSN